MKEPGSMSINLKNGVKIWVWFDHVLYAKLVREYEAKGAGSTIVVDIVPEEADLHPVSVEFPVELLESVTTTKVETTTFVSPFGDRAAIVEVSR
jgi:hypothetical protein